MINNKNVRSYEVSIWTLQDDFISVLKWSNLEQKGCIENPQMVLKDDGENTFSFKLPMYIKQKGEYVENPLWYNITNGILIASLRKLKVIFNKKTTDEKVFEFLITKVTESHEGYEKYCEVESEGLAFNELGKQGYNITLSGQDDVITDFYEVDSFDNNIDYWVKKVLGNPEKDSPVWSYIVQMDWSSYDGIFDDSYIVDNVTYSSENYTSMSIEERDIYNTQRENRGLRRRDKIYEDDYISAWNYNDTTDELTGTDIVEQREKYRLIDAAESNKYNLLQTIAETFQVYTKYEYLYDDNYHIIGRRVIFYNNYLQEKEGFLDFTYKYDTTNISREMDGTDTITKMFVKSLNDTESPSGTTSIGDTEANKSLENYLLNFDYMYEIGAISEEQYEAIAEFEKIMHKLNAEMVKQSNISLKIQMQLPELQAKLTTLEGDGDAGTIGVIQQAQESIESASEAIQMITDGNGEITYSKNNPKLLYARQKSDGKYYVKAPFGGIITSTLKLYKDVECDTEINGFKLKTNSEGNLTQILNLPKNLNNNICYATFTYKPKLEYENIINAYTKRMFRAQKQADKLNAKIEKLENKLETAEDALKSLQEEKEKELANFERLMGPALREGTWQPEDEYSNYGDKVHNIYTLTPTSTFDENAEISIGWDKYREEDGEDSNFYEYGAQLTDLYYPCIDLRANSKNGHPIYSTLYYRIKNNPNFLAEMSYVYFNQALQNLTDEKTKIDSGNIQYCQYFQMGAGVELAFLQPRETISGYSASEVIPVLMFTEPTYDSNVDFQTTISNYGRLGIVNADYDDNDLEVNVTDEIKLFGDNVNIWLDKAVLKKCDRVYPRIKVNNKWLKVSGDNLKITIYDNIYSNKTQDNTSEDSEVSSESILELKENYDYYILADEETYYITIKPDEVMKFAKHIFMPLGSATNTKTGLKFPVDMIFSNTALAVYLDAQEIMKENAFPKVSYDITPTIINSDFYKTAYNRLHQLIHINDPELKFENVMGYISEVDLDLDKPQEDKIIVKNYKTKFEDLFSTIVAQTEEMKKNSYLVGVVTSSFNNDGTLKDRVIDNILEKVPVYTPIYQAPISPAIAYENYELQIKTLLTDVFKDAGSVLKEATGAVSDVNSLNITNSNILSSFKASIANSLETAKMDVNQKTGEIKLYSKDQVNKNTSLFKINNTEGIYIGSNMPINFYSGNIDETNSAASALINSNRILFGVSNGSSGTAVDMNSDRIVIGAANIVGADYNDDNYNNTISAIGTGSSTSNQNNNTTTGLYLSRTEFRLATGTATERNYISMNSNGIKIANATNESNGSAVVINKDGVLIGLTSKKNDLVGDIQGTSHNITYSGAKFQVYAKNFVVDEAGHLYAYGADITGAITATSGKIGSWYLSDYHIGDTEHRATSQTGLSNYSDIRFWAGNPGQAYENDTVSLNKDNLAFYITKNGYLYANNANIKGTITATSGYIGSTIANQIILGDGIIRQGKTSLTDGNTGFFLSKDGLALGASSAFKVTSSGEITATNGTFTGVTINGATSISGSTSINTSGSISLKGSSLIIKSSDGEDDDNYIKTTISKSRFSIYSKNKTANIVNDNGYINFQGPGAYIRMIQSSGSNYSNIILNSSQFIEINGDTVEIKGNQLDIDASPLQIYSNTIYIESTYPNSSSNFRILIQHTTPTGNQISNTKNNGIDGIIWVELPDLKTASATDWTTCNIKYLRTQE